MYQNETRALKSTLMYKTMLTSPVDSLPKLQRIQYLRILGMKRAGRLFFLDDTEI